MTEIELKEAQDLYRRHLQGKSQILECLSDGKPNYFLHKFVDTNRDKIASIEDDEILRNSFLSVFRDTKESSNLVVSLNYIQKLDATLSDGQLELMSIVWNPNKMMELSSNEETLLKTPNGLNIYNLYCDLETNKPYLISREEKKEFLTKKHQIFIPFKPKTETYHYNSSSLEKITKGSATASFNKLQLYYFRQLLDSSREEAVTRVRSLTSKDLEKICLK